jgi:hypothetical protein
MADGSKSILFTFKSEDQSLARLKTSIREITKDLEKLVTTANSLNLGGGRGGGVNMGGGGASGASGTSAPKTAYSSSSSGGLAASFTEASKAMRDLGITSKDSLRNLGENSRAATSHLDKLAETARETIGYYKELANMSKPGGMTPPPLPSQTGASVWGPAGPPPPLQGGPIAPPGAWGGGPGAQVHAAGTAPPGPLTPPGGGFGLQGFGSMGQIAALLGVAKWGLDEQRAGTRGFSTAAKDRADSMRGPISDIMSGDYSFAYAARTLDWNQRKDLREQTHGTGAWLEQQYNALSQAGSKVPIIGPVAKGLGIIGSKDVGGGSLGGFQQSVQETEMSKDAVDMIKANQATQIIEGYALRGWQSSLGQRMSRQKLMGTAGRHYDKKEGRWVDPYSESEVTLTKQGYDTGAQQSGFASLLGAGRQFAGQNANLAMHAQAAGLGGFSELAVAAAKSGGGAGLALRALGGGIDPLAGVQLGQLAIGQGFDVRGTTSGAGALTILQNAAASMGGLTKGPEAFNIISKIGAGMQLSDAVVGGSLDQYQQGRNLVTAMGIKPQSDVYAQDYLANGMTTKQMLDAMGSGGQLTETAKQLGISKEDIRKQYGGSISSVLSDRLPGMKGTKMGSAVESFLASGQDLTEYLGGITDKNEKIEAIKSLGTAYNIATGSKIGEEAGIGAVATAGSVDDKTRRAAGGVGGGIRGDEKVDAEARAERLKTISDKMAEMGQVFTDVIKDSPKTFEKMVDFSKNLTVSADDFIATLTKLTGAMKIAMGEEPTPVKATSPEKTGVSPNGTPRIMSDKR